MSSFATRFLSGMAVWALSCLFATVAAAELPASKPTIVLVHGAFAESSSWNPVIAELTAKGYPTIAAANPLRGLKSDASYVASVVRSVSGPVVLVGHSYGGSVISNAATGASNVKALVYVAAFAPDKGESAITLSAKFPGSTLGPALAAPVVLADGTNDLYIQQAKLPAQFAADLPVAEARRMAATQRPVTEAALNEASGEAAWKTIPSWFIYGEADKNIPAAALEFMAKRAGAQKSIGVRGASHVVMLSHPKEVAAVIEEAAATAQLAVTSAKR
jgi:pimeloyl-ACP methyl ester carboxylesterase